MAHSLRGLLGRIRHWPSAVRLLGALAAALALAALYLASRKPITIVDGGQSRTVLTHAATVNAAVRAAGIHLYPEDLTTPALDAPAEPGQTIIVQRAQTVLVADGERQVTVRTRDASPWAILGQAGIAAQPDDALWVDGIPFDSRGRLPTLPPLAIVVRRPVDVQVTDDDVRRELRTSAATVGEALWLAGIRVTSGDGVSPELAAPISDGMRINLRRSRPIEILLDGVAIRTRTHAETVGEVLSEAGVVLVGLDYSIPTGADSVPNDGAIRVVRVKEELVTQQSYFPFETVYQPSANLELDTTAVLQAGTDGIAARRYRIRYDDGVEVSRTLDREWVSRAAVPKIIGYGTQVVVRTADTPDGPIEYWRAVRMYSTSYSASRSGTSRDSPWYGRTRTGKVLTKGMVAVDPAVIPLGTRLYIPTYGFATAEDTGGAIKGLRIDLGYDDWNYVSRRGDVTVYFLTPVPPADQIRWVLP